VGWLPLVSTLSCTGSIHIQEGEREATKGKNRRKQTGYGRKAPKGDGLPGFSTTTTVTKANKNKKRNERKPSHPPPIMAHVVRTYVGVRVRRSRSPSSPNPARPRADDASSRSCTTTAPPNHARTAFLIGTEPFASAAASSTLARRGQPAEPMTGGRVTTSGAGDGQSLLLLAPAAGHAHLSCADVRPSLSRHARGGSDHSTH
jgi:hypothetical protein